MDKRLIGIGLLLVILSFAWAYLSASSSMPSQSPALNFTHKLVAVVAPNSPVSGSLFANSTSLLDFYYISAKPLNFYLFNSSGASYLNTPNLTALNIAILSNATVPSLSVAVLNSTHGNIPYQFNYSAGATPPTFETQNASILLPGTYYFLFENTAGTPDNVTYSYAVIPLSSISETYMTALSGFNPVPSILFIVGILVAVYGLFRPKGKKAELAGDVVAQQMYAQMESKKTTSKAAPRRTHSSPKKKRRRSAAR